MNELGKLAAKLLEIDEAGAGQRLDNFLLRHLKGAPKSLIYRIIRSGEVRVNKGRADAADRLNLGDLVRIPPVRLGTDPDAPATPPAGAAKAALEIPVLYEDDALLALNKPAGVAVHGGSGLKYGVIEAMRAARPQARFLELVHRLDRETSGVLLLAKKRPALVAMHELLREGKTDKRYLTLIKGNWPHEAKHHVRTSLHKFVTAGGERRVTATDAEDGQEAHTIFTLVKRFPEATLLEAQLKTGRTHQIRVHLASSGHPIIGDDKYGDFDLNKRVAKAGLKRMFLHAARISFVHPVTGERLRVEAALPEDCAHYLESL
ncbi:MAG TPA: RluA family pseudouridine synthase [Burkholderiales bacterium]|jgi:23S rRNA pseudouridine955/2504/2580 synthase